MLVHKFLHIQYSKITVFTTSHSLLHCFPCPSWLNFCTFTDTCDHIYTNFTQMQGINWCSLSYPWPFPVHAGKRRTEVETSPGKHSLYYHHQCPIEVSSVGKWCPLVSHCSWLQSLPKDKILHCLKVMQWLRSPKTFSLWRWRMCIPSNC